MRIKFTVFALLLLIVFGCSNASHQETRVFTTQYGSIKALQAHLEADKMAWWIYHKKHIILSTAFSPLNINGKDISKQEFLETLDTGDFIALEVKDEAGNNYYQLRPLSEDAEQSISGTVEVEAYVALEHFLQEGKDFPTFEFNDLDGNQFTNESLEGKAIFLKTWFIACAPCIKEMPDLNEMVEKYTNREDVIFISLALDEPDALKQFLTKRKFDYKVVAEQSNYILESLVNLAYPTHYIIGPDGKVKKITNNFEELELARIAMGI